MVERVYWLAALLAGNNIGAGGRNRTGTPIQEQDFKSCVSTNSTTPATEFETAD